MSDPIGTYTFLPWIRSGVSNQITTPAVTARASVAVSLDVEGKQKGGGTTTVTVNRDVELYGPGDIIGIDKAQISRIEPEHWVTNFEPNYLAAIEFYDEDFPWRYTPATAVGRKLQPWLVLVVLEEEKEFKEGVSIDSRPLPNIEVTAAPGDVFPDASESWAWAHAHFNDEFSAQVVENDATLAAEAAQQIIDHRPDIACSRLLCPRKLKPKTAYHAFLVPAFETGRLAGLGHDPTPLLADAANTLTALSPAWSDYGVPANRPDSTLYPYYHRWYFRTAERGDFESLVRLLKPRIVDSRVGHRDMDVTDPAPNVVGIDDADLNGFLRLGGALKAPFDTLGTDDRLEFTKYDEWAEPYPQPFQTQLSTFVNLADSYQQEGPAANLDASLDNAVNIDPDPLITPPIYGRWHALTERLLTERDGSDVSNRENWLHDLNLDPRWRTAAGFGTTTVQQNQEEYMEAAWDQIGDVLEANRRIRQAKLAMLAGNRIHKAHISASARVNTGKLMMMSAPMSARLVSGGLTLRHQLTHSPLSVAMTSSAMRRAVRPAGKIAKRLSLTHADSAGTIVARVNNNEISAAPPREVPRDLLTPDDLSDAIEPTGTLPRFWLSLGKWLNENRLLAAILLLVLLVVLFLLFGFGALGLGAVGGVAAVAFWIWRQTRSAVARQNTADSVQEENLTPETVDSLPGSSGFNLTPDIDIRNNLPDLSVSGSELDNPEALHFKTALRQQYQLIETSAKLGAAPAMVPLNLNLVATDILTATQPGVTVPRWVLSGIRFPARILDQIGETFVEAMAYPEIDIPMYEPLVKAGDELFVPNLHLVEPDSVTLLETNQKFIEAYMVGLNHEFARELLWREYVTDQRGSYFRQFWDVRKKIAEATDKEAAREEFKDIKPIHRWPQANDLGDNDNREAGVVAEEELVLVIRGELLKKYPNTIISAQKASWQTNEDGSPNKKRERVFEPSSEPITPLYEARVAPDIYFFGFDLTALEARGDDTVDDKPGWFFRIEEVPGDARFGFDISRDPAEDINVWNDLAWPDVMPSLADGLHIKVADIPAQTLIEPLPGSESEKIEQWESDNQVPFDSDISSAEFAYVALQTPVIMAVHASELLPDQE